MVYYLQNIYGSAGNRLVSKKQSIKWKTINTESNKALVPESC